MSIRDSQIVWSALKYNWKRRNRIFSCLGCSYNLLCNWYNLRKWSKGRGCLSLTSKNRWWNHLKCQIRCLQCQCWERMVSRGSWTRPLPHKTNLHDSRSTWVFRIRTQWGTLSSWVDLHRSWILSKLNRTRGLSKTSKSFPGVTNWTKTRLLSTTEPLSNFKTNRQWLWHRKTSTYRRQGPLIKHRLTPETYLMSLFNPLKDRLWVIYRPKRGCQSKLKSWGSLSFIKSRSCLGAGVMTKRWSWKN